ncbi:hypothetical protein GCM10010885_13500 [Alicyclobacillus cellulosilyticus]|uniref:YprB ribonuclease H-like domain-containing protein n=1 Tax=Alicyclobacillus cellulosilyticus TaxID=1003997 RepID=A0A917K9F4_9BACL|nr:ribonuclease H-like domain-containing protein [Alicyclobacillus cellulosilyticus]GGJ05671.1 hypothetical protein GCM10010885_13500 [Alicyclobacillus cellulosilyticus]
MARSLWERLQRLEASVRRAGGSGAPDHPAHPAGTAAGPAGGAGTTHVPDAAAAALADAAHGKDAKPGAPDAAAVLRALGFVREQGAAGWYWVRRLRCDRLTAHGCVRLGEVDHPGLVKVVQAAARVGAWSGRPEDVFFYDTESTGLGTGAGTFPFLHGVGYLAEDEWVMEQWLVADYAEEPAVLQAVRERLCAPGAVVMTFNGKAFDWPLLQSRLRLYRMDFAGEPLQADLMHPCRRLWRKQLEKVSLGRLETHVLGLTRQGDLPGREAPARYFAFLTAPRAEDLEPVLAHNAADLCALAGLAAVLARLYTGEQPPDGAHGYAALGAWHAEWREHEVADRCYRAAVHAPDADWRVRWLASLYFKRQGQWSAACAVWAEMADRHPWTVAPLVELAKFAEHHARDLAAARRWTALALERAAARHDRSAVDELRHRLARIERKLAAAPDMLHSVPSVR